MVEIAHGTRKTLYTSVSNETYAKLKKAKKMGWASGRLIDYLIENYMPSVLLEDEIIDNYVRGNLPTPAFDESPFEPSARKPSNKPLNAEAL